MDTEGMPTYENAFVQEFLRPAHLSGNPLASVWNSLPWTWLIDYFGTIGSFIEASGGKLPYEVRNMCIMFHTVDTVTLEPVGPYSGDFSGGHNRTETKQRTVYLSPTPTIWYKNALTRHQKNILLALVTSKLLGTNPGVNG
jgi:hypothetical protein